MYVDPLQWSLGSDASDLLFAVGSMPSAIAFFTEFLSSRLNRGLREGSAAIDERNCRDRDEERTKTSKTSGAALDL